MKKRTVFIFLVLLIFVSKTAYSQSIDAQSMGAELFSALELSDIQFFNDHYKETPLYLIEEFEEALSSDKWSKLNDYLYDNNLFIEVGNVSALQITSGELIVVPLISEDPEWGSYLTKKDIEHKDKYTIKNFLAYLYDQEYGDTFFFLELLIEKNNIFGSKLRWVFPANTGYEASLSYPFFKEIDIISERNPFRSAGLYDLWATYCIIVLSIALVVLVVGLVVLIFTLTFIFIFIFFPGAMEFMIALGVIICALGTVIIAGPGIICILFAP